MQNRQNLEMFYCKFFMIKDLSAVEGRKHCLIQTERWLEEIHASFNLYSRCKLENVKIIAFFPIRIDYQMQMLGSKRIENLGLHL